MNFTRNLIALALTGLVATTGMAMDKAEHTAAKDRISADYKMAKQNCDALKDNAKDVCMKEAKGTEDIAKAELEAQYKPNDKSAYKVAKARAGRRRLRRRQGKMRRRRRQHQGRLQEGRQGRPCARA